MQPTERRAVFSLATLHALRMLGLFMVMPIFTLYAQHLTGSTPLLIGIAIGIYGLTQSLLQIPFGTLSDYFGRKPIILIGLGIFIVGSIIAATSSSIIGVIIGRALQGAGAIGSAVLALLADFTQEESRTKAMAVLGLIVGGAFTLAMLLGPLLNTWISLAGMFWLASGLAFLAILILLIWVPKPQQINFHRDIQLVPALVKSVIKNKVLLTLNLSILVLHAILAASFVILPIILTDTLHFTKIQQGYFYLILLVCSFCTMFPFIYLSEKKQHLRLIFLSAIAILALTQLNLWCNYDSVFAVSLSLFGFFTAFNFLEASLPSMISKLAPPESKGTAMGIYSSAQFLGIFLGGIFGGFFYGENLSYVFAFCAIIAGLWFSIVLRLRPQRHTNSLNKKIFYF